MISKQNLKDYEFNSIEDYFNYIDNSRISGNFSQVKSLFNDLSKEQKKAFFVWANDCDCKKTIKYITEECL